MNGRDLFAKGFVTERYFTIALRKRQGESILENMVFSPEFLVPATRQRWCADPILVDAEGKTWLFYEAVLGDHGHIEVAEVRDDCTLGEPLVVLQDGCHYSYPFVFRHENTWYMIPESSAAGEVRLYRAAEFPAKWEQWAVLLREKAVDTTVLEQDGQLYLLTYVPDGTTERVTPKAFRLTITSDGAGLEALPWERFDSLRVRGAGPVFRAGEDSYRPAQISREQHYGDGLVFYRVTDAAGYREEPVAEMGPARLKIRGKYADGLHTYCRSERFEAIDIRCGTVDFAKPIKKLFRKG